MLHWSVHDHPLSRDGVHLLWNSRTDQLIRLSDAERQAFLRSETPELTGERLAQFSRGGFLTECADEPAEVMRSLMRMRRLLTPHFRILLTTACNARCAYCYQQDAPVMRMTDETARETAAFIMQQARECQSQRAMLEWFGGEPTLEARTAEIICRKLQESGLSFASSLVTNGLLLDSTFLPLCEALCLKHVQITLDGMEGEHERIKGFPPGSFQRVIRSAEQCLREGLRVTLRLNMAQDAQALMPLLDALAERFSPLPDGLAIRLAPLYEPCQEIPAAVMREVLKAGGFTKGGLNFDAKTRRGSNTPEDLAYSYIAGMDAFALGLRMADKIERDGRLDDFVAKRYAGYSDGIGKRITDRTATIEELEASALEKGEVAVPMSGRQEYLENILNEILLG